MTQKLPATRTRMWLARGAILGCIAIVVLLHTVGFGGVTVSKDGEATVYTGSAVVPVIFGFVGVLVCVLAVVFWMQPGRVFTLFSGVAFLIGVWAFLNVPNTLIHRVAVRSDSFTRRVGTWYSPVEHYVEFDKVMYMYVAETEAEPDGRTNYELQCHLKPNGRVIAIPIFDLMRTALLEILRKAESRGVVIGERPDGRRIPREFSNSE